MSWEDDVMIEQEVADLLYEMGEVEWKDLTDLNFDKMQMEKERKITLS